ncbi:oxysterol-binding protein-related protein 10-like [Silurus asotus]|uniref:Oxysterol-binding protein-related protein 10-like n=1 Tax=Silurus asotus TaxID=30991 RepID=A0AAD5FSL4_SILAS|nr:oxysterol-binding protein-related protein 10-like [Silurus asotus]
MEKSSHTNGARASAVTGNSSPNQNHSRADRTRRTTGREGGERRRGEGGGIGRRPQMEGVLSKYTNLLQGWQNRYFVLDEELHQLQYFVNEQGRSQKPRGILSLIGAVVTTSDEAPHMFVVISTNGELFKLRGLHIII